MRRDPEYFGEREMDTLYVARKLRDATRLEAALTEAGIDYAVEADNYVGGLLFRTERVGAFFYVLPEALEAATQVLTSHKFV